MNEMVGCLVRVTPKSEWAKGRVSHHGDIGRLMKVFTDGSKVMICNVETKKEEDIVKSELFRWGYWIAVSEADLVVVED